MKSKQKSGENFNSEEIMDTNKKEKQVELDQEVLITFLKRTKEGKYAKIEESSLEYVRMQEEDETIEEQDEEYYYSIS